jgi:hypothetical protein
LLPAGNARLISVPLKKHRWLQKLPLGSPLQMRLEPGAERPCVVQLIARTDGQLWDVRSASRPEPVVAATTRKFNGVLRVQTAGFGFVEDIFVPLHLINKSGWQTGQQLRGTAVSRFDQKKNKDGWVVKQADSVADS